MEPWGEAHGSKPNDQESDMETQFIAIFDTNAGFLQWIGEAASHETAIKTFDADIGLRPATEIEVEEDPTTYTAVEVLAILNSEEGVKQ